MQNKEWTEDEISYMRRNWGQCTRYQIACRTGRSVSAVNQKAKKLKLGPWENNTDKVTANMLADILGTYPQHIVKTYITNNGLPCSIRKVSKQKKTYLLLIQFQVIHTWMMMNTFTRFAINPKLLSFPT